MNDYGGTNVTTAVAPGVVAGMGSPVCCTFCGQVYDLQAVVVTQRYADCSMFRSPCCDRLVDDRPASVSHPAFRRVEPPRVAKPPAAGR